MSVAFTEQAVIERRKTVTRRKGWLFVKPGDRLTLCRKVMGRKPGEPLVRIAEVEVVDVRREAIAVKEGNILNIPVVAMVDTNCDPEPVDLVIPSNDDAIRAIKLIVGHISDAVNEGLQIRQAVQADEEVEEDEKYLGAATLAKLRSGEFAFEDDELEEDEIEDEEEYED